MKRVYLQITDACNLNCPFCSYEKGNHFLSLNQIDDYLLQIKKYCDYIYLHITGEPLLHPDFNEILNLLDKYQLHLQLVTNGTLFYKYPDLLNHSCLRKLSISLHSVNNIDVDNNYFENINNLLLNDDTNIELRFYDFDNLNDKLKNYLDSLINKYNLSLTDKKNSYRLKDNVYIYYSPLFKWPEINDDFISDKGYCLGGKQMIAINCHSDVCICCLDPKAYNKIGNLKENSLDEILKSPIYLKHLENLKKHELTFDLCKKCSYRLRFD